jgi:Zn-dependent protease with chaperone function
VPAMSNEFTRNESTRKESTLAIALPILQRIAAAGGEIVPRLVVINRWGLKPRATSAVAKTRVRAGARSVIALSPEVVSNLSAPALEFLLAHEYGHIALRRSPWARARRVCGVVLFVLGCLSLAAAVFLPVFGTLVVVVLVAVIFVILGAGLFASRRHEEEADDYAAAYQGNLRGAEELFQWLAVRRAKAQAAGALSGLMATHPRPLDRLERLARKLKDAARGGPA